MDKKELLEIVDALSQQVNKAAMDEIEVETDEFRVKLTKRNAVPAVQVQPAAQTVQPAAPAVASGGRFVKAPLIGTFYAAAAPGKPPFVSVGDKVSKGSVVCIVESMKLMNEITSEFDGTVAEILVSDGDSVEYDQPLIRIDA